jgi:hypothetical protein
VSGTGTGGLPERHEGEARRSKRLRQQAQDKGEVLTGLALDGLFLIGVVAVNALIAWALSSFDPEGIDAVVKTVLQWVVGLVTIGYAVVDTAADFYEAVRRRIREAKES